MSKQVELDNMFGIGTGSKKYIRVPEESEDIINKIINTYNNVYKYFDETEDVDSLKKAYNNIKGSMYSAGTCQTISSELKEIFGKINGNYNLISSAIINGDWDNLDILGSIPFNLIFFSIFKYNDNNYEDLYHIESYDINEENKIFEYFHTSDGLHDGYRFLKQNYFFELMDMMVGESWRDQGAKLDPSGLFNQEKNIDTITLLTNGYKVHSKNEKTYILFPQKNDIKEFIYQCIINNLENTLSFSDFSINILDNMVFGLSDKISKTLEDRITMSEQSKKGNDAQYKIGKSSVVIRSASNDVTSYSRIFDYSIELLKSYVEALKNSDPNITTQKIYKDQYVVKLVNKIIGAEQSSSGVLFKENNSISIFDSENKGHAYIDFISNKSGLTPQIVLNVTGGESKNLNNINKEEYSLSQTHIQVSEARDCSTYFKNLESKLKDSSIDQSIYFYETAIYGDGKDGFISADSELNIQKNKNNVSSYQAKINEFSKMSGCVISKFIFLSLYDLNKKSEVKYNNGSVLECSSYSLIKKYTYANQIIYIDNSYYYEYSKAYKALASSVLSYINDIIKLSGNSAATAKAKQEVLNQASSFRSYVKSRIGSDYYTEKDYFYINDGINGKKMPSNPFVDIEFRVPRYSNDGKTIEAIEWLPVTSVRVGNTTEDNKIVVNDSSAESYREMYAGTYFDSFELVDNGGVKEINLTLKSSNDINLEKIIFNSLSLDDKLRTLASNSGNIASYIDTMLKDTESNFRIRFGYRDVAANDASNNETTITSSNNSSKEFLERTKVPVKPVLVYPWTYFKIIGLDSNIKDGEDTYSIKAVSSGDYILSHMSLCGISTNFSKEAQDDNFRGTPLNVVGKIAKWITLASCDDNEGGKEKDITTARICFLGDTPGTIITDFNNIENSFDDTYKFELKGEQSIKGGNIKTIEKSFFNSSNNQVLTAKNFNITNDVRVPSIKEVLDNLVKWLPSRVYYIAKLENTKQTVALYIPYETIYTIDDFFTNPAYPHKSEEMTYQIIEADAHIYKGEKSFSENERNDKNFYHKVYFIRMYYEGPGISTTKKGEVPNEYLRIYNYRSLQEQVIENVEISSTNDSEFGNTIASVMMLGSGTPITIAYNRNTGKQYENATSVLNSDTINIKDVSGFKDLGRFSSWFSPKENKAITPKLVYNNSQYILSDVKGYENFDAISSMYVEEASNFFTAMQNKQYEGELTIIGDPFYYFDSSLEAGKYEIYLQMNRVKDMKSYELAESKYSGIYFIKGIKHNMDQNGKYTTTLSIVKRVFGSDDGNINKS